MKIWNLIKSLKNKQKSMESEMLMDIKSSAWISEKIKRFNNSD